MYYMDTGYKTVSVNDWVTVRVNPPAPGHCRYKVHWQDEKFSTGKVVFGSISFISHLYTVAGTYAPRIEFLPNVGEPGVDCLF